MRRRLTDDMLTAEAKLVRELRGRLRKRPRYAVDVESWTFGQLSERMKLAGIAQAVRAIRKGQRR